MFGKRGEEKKTPPEQKAHTTVLTSSVISGPSEPQIDIWQEFPVPPLLAPIPLPIPVRVQTGTSNTNLTVRNRYLIIKTSSFDLLTVITRVPHSQQKLMALSLWWKACSQPLPHLHVQSLQEDPLNGKPWVPALRNDF